MARDYIDALNQIEVEFYKFSDVRQAHQELMDFFGDRNHWDRLVELENRSTLSEEDKKRYQSFFDNHRSKLESLVVRLLEVIGIRLRYRFEQLDLLKGGYAPTAYGEIENDQVSIRRLFAQIGRGERALPVMTYAPQPLSKTERSE